MSSPPFMPLWIGDFHRKTTYLDARETGAYMLLIMALWTCGGRLPSDQKKLQRVAKCGREWPKVWDAISQYFDDADGFITQARVTEELQKCAAKREVNAHNGARGGRAKALKRNEPSLANATNSLERNSSISEPESEKKEERGKPLSRVPDGFEEFWAEVPRKVSKDDARKAYAKALRKTDARTLIEGMRRYAQSRIGQDPQYTKHPASWLNAGKWEDEPEQMTGGNHGNSKGERRIQSWLAGASIAPRVDCGPDTDASLPLLARR